MGQLLPDQPTLLLWLEPGWLPFPAGPDHPALCFAPPGDCIPWGLSGRQRASTLGWSGVGVEAGHVPL